MDLDARQELRKKIEALPGGFAEAAEMLGVSSAWLYIVCKTKITKRKRKVKNVSVELAVKLRDIFGIPAESWFPGLKSKDAA